MEQEITFLLNDNIISTQESPNLPLLDFIRYNQLTNLKGTKIGCREGDCGACTVLIGEIDSDNLVDPSISYKSINSCLTPLGKVHGKHVVTIEGINNDQLTLIQQSFVDHGASQCGFCTPGFIMSLTGYFLSNEEFSYDNAITSVDGNICRCTGYKSIERAIKLIIENLKDYNEDLERLEYLVNKKIIPTYFNNITQKLIKLNQNKNEIHFHKDLSSSNLKIAGGTDLFVQIPDQIINLNLHVLNQSTDKNIIIKKESVNISALTTVSEFFDSPIINHLFPQLKKAKKLFASTPIRNSATLGGNIVNASPIGDMIIIFLSLNASLEITDNLINRTVNLKDFYLDYKKLDLNDNEIVKSIILNHPFENNYFNFEKIAKRTHLDIASVNTAINIDLDDSSDILNASLSIGGVAPIPLFLKRASEYLIGKNINELESILKEIDKLIQQDISPISDIRGSAEYKRLLARNLLFAHFHELFPSSINLKELLA